MLNYNGIAPIHWGEVSQFISLAGGDPASGAVAGITARSSLAESSGESKTTSVTGSGGTQARTGGSRRNGVGGSSR